MTGHALFSSYDRAKFACSEIVAIMFQWHASDLDDNVRSALHELREDTLVPTSREYLPSIALHNALMKSSLYRLIVDNCQFYAWVRERAALFRQGSLGIYEGIDPVVQYQLRLFASLLKYARDEVTESGRSFLVMDMPNRITQTTFESTWWKGPRHIATRIDNAGCMAAVD